MGNGHPSYPPGQQYDSDDIMSCSAESTEENTALVDLFHATQKKLNVQQDELLDARSELLRYKRDTSIDVLEQRIKLLEMEKKELMDNQKKYTTIIQHQKHRLEEMENCVEQLESVKILCGICEENPINSVFIPCYHAYACYGCASSCDNCPVCRGRAGLNKLYLKGI